jgi:hypothetical protein
MMKETIASGIDGFTGRARDDFIVGVYDRVDAAYIPGMTGLCINRQRKNLSESQYQKPDHLCLLHLNKIFE